MTNALRCGALQEVLSEFLRVVAHPVRDRDRMNTSDATVEDDLPEREGLLGSPHDLAQEVVVGVRRAAEHHEPRSAAGTTIKR
jgi:hypothetical protein